MDNNVHSSEHNQTKQPKSILTKKYRTPNANMLTAVSDAIYKSIDKLTALYNIKETASEEFQQHPKLQPTEASTSKQIKINTTVCDDDSRQGHFCWTAIENIFIPYIFRSNEEYCAAKMFENLILSKYVGNINPELYVNSVPGLPMTAVEANLFNSIKVRNYPSYSDEQLSNLDIIVSLTDINNFYEFITFCYKLQTDEASTVNNKKCGFIRINKKPVVPYILREDSYYVPLKYFEGNVNKLRGKAVFLTPDEWNYMKLCLLILGTRKELFDRHTPVVPLEELIRFYPTDNIIEEFWPTQAANFAAIGKRNSKNYVPLSWVYIFDEETANS